MVATVVGNETATNAQFAAALSAGAPPAALLEIATMAHLFGGFPRAIQGLLQLDRCLADRGIELPATKTPARSRGDDRARGDALFRQIYGDSSDTVLARLASPVRDFQDIVLEHAYGRILSRPGLSAPEREWFAVAALAALDCPAQLKSHVRGALRLGVAIADLEQLAAVLVRDLTAWRSEQLRRTIHEAATPG
ncbi:MAG: hypothetical protein EXS13_03360 [Planctomycetes bacterium]|nr:hypothetical protein [Planctomycetota bacterium]